MTTSGSHPGDPAHPRTQTEQPHRAAPAREDTEDTATRRKTYAGPDDDQGLGARRTRQEATERQQRRFGGMKVGSAFFGWLTATGAAVLLTALVVVVGAAVGVSTGTSLDQVSTQATQGTDTAKTVGLAGGIALLVVLLDAYFCGGYVAERMARFNGLTHGLGVWLWAVLIDIAVAVVSLLGGLAGMRFHRKVDQAAFYPVTS